MRKDYNKLVRDLIPQIIADEDREAHIRILNEKEAIGHLEKKLLEEVNEYLEDKTIEELADILEVIYALCKLQGVPVEELERAREIKKISRGSFDKRIYLEYVE